jgi:hypothetical protein
MAHLVSAFVGANRLVLGQLAVPQAGADETRRVWVTDAAAWLGKQLLAQWPGLASIACVERVREVIGGKTETERHYYISSVRDCDAATMDGAVRGHWGIENLLHWHLDVSFDEHACRVRKEPASHIAAALCIVAPFRR